MPGENSWVAILRVPRIDGEEELFYYVLLSYFFTAQAFRALEA